MKQLVIQFEKKKGEEDDKIHDKLNRLMTQQQQMKEQQINTISKQ